MSQLPASSLFKIILENRSSKRFLLATIFSFAFSMTVILATIGLMDGFTSSLKKALAHSNGDIKFSALNKFFLDNEELKDKLLSPSVSDYTTLLQLESFALIRGESKGVLLRGIDVNKFSKMTGLRFEGLKKGVFVGDKFKEKYNLKLGDEFVLAFTNRKDTANTAVKLITVAIDGFVKHGVYEKDFRYIYIDRVYLEQLSGHREGASNYGLLKINQNFKIKDVAGELNREFIEELDFRPYWSEFNTLIEAVEMEKVSISLILQLIVLVAILNIMGFIIFISETKAQDFFMLRALGLSFDSYQKFWYILLGGTWFVSCFVSEFFIFILNKVILKLPIFEIPADIYVLAELKLKLEILDYLYVFGLSFLWIMLVGFITLKRQKKKSLLSGLRQEFA